MDLRYYLVGAPDSGKSVVTEKLSTKLEIPGTSGWFPGGISEEYAEGLSADYRVELWIAAGRAMYNYGNMIFTHSLLDSLAYASVRCSAALQAAGGDLSPQSVRWLTTLGAISRMAHDWKKDDALFLYLPYSGNDDDSQALDDTLVAAMREYDVAYEVINPEEEPEAWLSN